MEKVLKIRRYEDGRVIVEDLSDGRDTYREFAANDFTEVHNHISKKLNDMFPIAETLNIATPPLVDGGVDPTSGMAAGDNSGIVPSDS